MHAIRRSASRTMPFALAAGLLANAAPAVSAAPSASFPRTVLVRQGDLVTGVGLVTTIDNLAVNSSGQWIVQVDTSGDASSDSCLLKNGALFLREDQALASPAGTRIGSFDSVNLNNNGRSGWNFFLRGATTTTDSGIFHDADLLIQESNISTAPELSPNTPYIGYFDAKINDLEQVAIVASVDDPLIPSTVDRALVIVTLDQDGTMVSQSAFAKEGQVLPGQTETVVDFGTDPHESAFNNQGEMFYFADLTGPTATDGVLYLGLKKIAQEGGASPVAGRNYETLSSRGLDVNNLGEVTFRANLDGDASTDEMIVVEGKQLIREGSTLPDVAPFLFTSFGLVTNGPTPIDDDRNVLWFGDWDNPDTTKDTGLFINDALIASEGAPVGGGLTIVSFASGQSGFSLSDNGRYVIAEVVLSNATQAAIRIEVDGPPPVPDGAKVPGAQMLAVKNGTDIDLTWDATSCPGTEYNLFYGDLASVSTLAYIGAACGLGTTGQATFTPPPGQSIFFILASEDAQSIEGGHGYDSRGRARMAGAGGLCGVRSQIRSALCPRT